MKNVALVISVVLLFLPSCAGVKIGLGGASIPVDAKTVSVTYFENRAPLASPTLSQSFTEAMRDIIQSQTSLNLVDKYGDLQFEGEITNYQTRPVAVQGNETAALNRLTISVNVRYTNTKNEAESFESSFSAFADFDQAQNLSSVEENLISEINGQLSQDIFNRAFANW